MRCEWTVAARRRARGGCELRKKGSFRATPEPEPFAVVVSGPSSMAKTGNCKGDGRAKQSRAQQGRARQMLSLAGLLFSPNQIGRGAAVDRQWRPLVQLSEGDHETGDRRNDVRREKGRG